MEITGTSNHGVREKHVAVFAFPFASHPSLLLTLALKLASAAPNVVFSFFNTEKSNKALFSKLTCENILPYNVSEGIPKDYVLQGKPAEELNLFLAVAEEEFRRVLKVAEEDIGLKVSCLVVDAFFSFTGDMADQMNIPWVALWPAGASSLSVNFYTDLIREKTAQLQGSVRPDDEIADLIPGLSKIRLGDLPRGVVFGDIESPFATMLHKMGRALPRATAIALNSFQDLDPDLTKDLSSKFKNFLKIGPFNLMSKQTQALKSEDKFSCISWLENKKPRSVAYISFGTRFEPPPHEIVELAEALEETKTPFLWSITKDSEKHFPQGFLERISANGTGKVVPWAPQAQVLEHFAIGVYVCHGGWNSKLESIGAGVPMICRPIIWDNQINTRMVERVWEIGVEVEGGTLTKNGTRCALEQVFSADGLLKRRKEKIEALKNLAHKAAEPNGSSNQNFKTLVDVVWSQVPPSDLER